MGFKIGIVKKSSPKPSRYEKNGFEYILRHTVVLAVQAVMKCQVSINTIITTKSDILIDD